MKIGIIGAGQISGTLTQSWDMRTSEGCRTGE
jgi:hypothetical protein